MTQASPDPERKILRPGRLLRLLAVVLLVVLGYSWFVKPMTAPGSRMVTRAMGEAFIACAATLRSGPQTSCDLWRASPEPPGGVRCRMSVRDPAAPRPETAWRERRSVYYAGAPFDPAESYDVVCVREKPPAAG